MGSGNKNGLKQSYAKQVGWTRLDPSTIHTFAMKNYFSGRLAEMESELLHLRERTKDVLDQCNEALGMLTRYNEEFCNKLRTEDFVSPEDEIHYFKNQRPLMTSEWIYYLKLYRMELKKPIGSPEMLKEYYVSEIAKIYRFYRENEAFVAYVRSGATELDSFFFLRSARNHKSICQSIHFILDHTQTTEFDWKLGKMLAFERLMKYLEGLDALTHDDAVPVAEASPYLKEASRELDLKLLLKSYQVERRLAISKSTLLRLRQTGQMPFYKIGGTIYFHEEDILEWIRRNHHKNFDN